MLYFESATFMGHLFKPNPRAWLFGHNILFTQHEIQVSKPNLNL